MIIFGIKNCDKVRAAMKQAKQVDGEVRLHDFREDGIDKTLITAMLADIDMQQLVNKRSTTYRQLDQEVQQNIDADTLVKHPTLIKRPVVLYQNHYSIGLPE